MSTLARFINSKISVREAYSLSLGHFPPSGKCFCPFHNNNKTPAAKVYDYGLRCFGECNRVYTSYDFLKKFRPDLIDFYAKQALPKVSQIKHQTLEQFVVQDSGSDILDQIYNYFSDDEVQSS